MKTETADSADVVIIGVGMAGLTTAAYLSRSELKVQVYEQHTLPGGSSILGR